MNLLYDYYNSDLRPVLVEQERKRKRLFAGLRYNMIMALGGSIVLTSMVVFWLVSEGLGYREGIIGMVVLTVFYMVTVWRTMIKYHTAEVKQATLSKVVKFIDPNLSFSVNSTISSLDLVASGFFEPKTTVDVNGEDLISGTAYGLGFRCSEIHLSRISSEFYDGALDRVTFRAQGYRGLFAVIELPQRLDSTVYIFPNNLAGRVNNLGTASGQIERIKVEDPMFERYFNAYGTDQLQARMILTTKLIDDIATLRQRLGSSIMLSIKHSTLYIAVSSSKDLFEPDIYESYLSPQHVRDYLKELNIVTQLVKDISEIFRES